MTIEKKAVFVIMSGKAAIGLVLKYDYAQRQFVKNLLLNKYTHIGNSQNTDGF